MDLAALYSDIVETSPDGIWVFDLDGHTLYANPRLAAMFGVDLATMAATSVLDCLAEAGRDELAQRLDGLREGRTTDLEVETEFVRPDGSAFWVLVRESVRRGPNGAITEVVHRLSDYTVRRQIVEELRGSRAQLAEAQRLARVGSWTWDVVRDRITGSAEIYELYGLDDSTFPQGYPDFLEMVHPDDRDAVAAAVQAALDGEDQFEFVARIRGQGDWLWTSGRGIVHRDDEGKPVAMSGTHQDITKAREVELELIDSVNQNKIMQAVATAANEAHTLNEVLAQARDLVLLHDDWERARGFVPTEDGDGVAPLYLSDDDQESDRSTPELNATELDVANRAFHERRCVWDDKRLTIAFPVSYADEVYAVVTITSAPPLYRHELIESMVSAVAVQLGRVAERERAERELADARDQAMAASRQKSDFLATMSHEIRTPLNGVIGLNDLLLRSGLDAAQLRLASGVQVASRALLAVINDILDFSKIEAGKLELERLDFEVRPVFDQLLSVMSETARAKGVELSVSCHPDVPETLAGDPTRLSQVLTNLVSNAVKFTEAGEVYVRATAEPVPEGTRLRVEVSDTGRGVEESQVAGLFDPFTQADASTTRLYGGTGLGLAISKEIAEALDGEIGYRPNEPAGSVFWFTGVFGEPTGSASDPEDEFARTWLSGHRVLVVDDNPHNRLILEEQLAWWQVRTRSVTDAESALTALAEAASQGDPFDAALLDLAMPGRDGLDLARDIRADPAYHDLVLLMLTSYATTADADVLDAGIAEKLPKPVTAAALRAALVSHLAGIEPHRVTESPAALTDGRRRRVLVVEDNVVNQMVALGLLESLGYVAETADDGIFALEALAREQYDAVLMDVQMPRMDGYAATREIRRREDGAPRVPVIAMTAAAVEGERERCLEAGMDDFLTKPVDPVALATVLDTWLGSADSSPQQHTATEGTTMDTGMGTVADYPEPDPDSLDIERLDMLRDLDEDNTTYLDRAIGNFMTNSRTGLDTIREAISAGDAAAMRAAAHKLAGSALNLGVTYAGEAVRTIEFLGDEGTVEGAEEKLPAVEAALARGREELLAYQASYSQGG
jgi:PAS domain S-box-containing protein